MLVISLSVTGSRNIDLTQDGPRKLAVDAIENIEATDPPLFLRFLNLLMNDAIYLLDEALTYMSQIREQQAERGDGSWPDVPVFQRSEREATFQHITMLARFHNHLGLATIKMLSTLTSEIKDIFYTSVLVDRIASMLNYFLLHLVGPKNREFKVKDFEKYEFKPAEMVTCICRIYVNLGENDNFCLAVSADGRSYSSSLFEQAGNVLRKIGEYNLLKELDHVAMHIKQASEQLKTDDEIVTLAPDEYLDPIMSTLMLDPVMLPSSKNVVDKSTIASVIFPNPKRLLFPGPPYINILSFQCVPMEINIMPHMASDPKAARARSFSKPWTDPVKQLITAESVARSLYGLSGRKSGGIDGVTANHIKHGGPSLICLLTLLFNDFLNHCYVPDSLTEVCLVPIPKSNAGDMTSLSNYRLIAVAAAISKLFEKCLYSLISPQIDSANYQFGFKEGSSTKLCILKSVVPVFACFVHAKATFDRVNFKKFLDKIDTKGVDLRIIGTLQYWFEVQRFKIKWRGYFSESFPVLNGVRQGGVLSPLLYKLYVDDLNLRLAKTGVGCFIGGVCFNNLTYTDDLVILAPTVAVLNH
ncbi:hypothetical protein QYM36_012654 [Artemia franciscana]|uniref:Ubiquitin conjugation factor E4 A n=1 Tax=Artemia franciscana TaxID=6661 RepID=A0AA88HQT1_ARTSF|nr:hypothetical protein QYM36_012654 [Artemia franciscana]